MSQLMCKSSELHNSLLYGLPKIILKQNAVSTEHLCCVRLTLRRGARDSITTYLKELHWLWIEQRIDYKILTLTHKCIHGVGTQYLQDLIVELHPNRQGLRSGNSPCLLLISRTKCKCLQPIVLVLLTLWNKLSDQLRTMDSSLSFKSVLKTHLFRLAYEL